MGIKIADSTVKALVASLNFRKMRQELIASNVANAETPGYKAKRLDFEAALQRAIDVDHLQSLHTNDDRQYNVGGGGFDNLEPTVYEDDDGVTSDDGNTVDREKEMAMMAENKILFDASVQLLNKKMGLLKYAVQQE